MTTSLPLCSEMSIMTVRQAIVLAIILLAIATAFAAISVEMFGGED
jgi:hypothetical protein